MRWLWSGVVAVEVIMRSAAADLATGFMLGKLVSILSLSFIVAVAGWRLSVAGSSCDSESESANRKWEIENCLCFLLGRNNLDLYEERRCPGTDSGDFTGE